MEIGNLVRRQRVWGWCAKESPHNGPNGDLSTIRGGKSRFSQEGPRSNQAAPISRNVGQLARTRDAGEKLRERAVGASFKTRDGIGPVPIGVRARIASGKESYR
jgi:hypothetical protein